jgi:hypothetical protein
MIRDEYTLREINAALRKYFSRHWGRRQYHDSPSTRNTKQEKAK